MTGPRVVSTKTNTSERTETKNGHKVRTVTTTIIETYSDGTTSTKTNIQTFGGGGGGSSVNQIHSNGNQKHHAPSSQGGGESQFRKEALIAHNDYRRKHHAPPLILNERLNQIAQNWANLIAGEGKMRHSQNRGDMGENIYMSSNGANHGKVPVDSWYSEIKDYRNYGDAQFNHDTGHFTQVVWKSSTEMGIARAKGRNGEYIVANYTPAGNYAGRFGQNVLRP